jgi:hypothetical protein
MVKSLAALSIFAVLGASVVALTYGSQAKTEETVASARGSAGHPAGLLAAGLTRISRLRVCAVFKPHRRYGWLPLIAA